MISVQLIGILIALGAIHLTFLYYKRSSFTKTECIIWLLIWVGFIFVAVFPRSLTPVVGYLGLQRSMDLIMIIAFIILFALTFQNYVTNRRVSREIEKLARKNALEPLDEIDNQTHS